MNNFLVKIKNRLNHTVSFLKSLNIDSLTVYFVGVVVVLSFVAIVAFLQSRHKPSDEVGARILPTWARDKPQSENQIEDLDIALPYVSEYFTISKGMGKDEYIVSYAPYVDKQDLYPVLEDFFTSHGKYQVTIYWDSVGEEKTVLEFGYQGE